MKRILLLAPATTYRAGAFLKAAHALRVDVVHGSDGPNLLSAMLPSRIVELDFRNADLSADRAAAFAKLNPIDAIVAVDDTTTVLGARVAAELGLTANPVSAVRATRDKALMRRLLAGYEAGDVAGGETPWFQTVSIDDNPRERFERVSYPIVMKPTLLSASRGVIRANSLDESISAFHRIRRILAAPNVAGCGGASDQILVEEFVPGIEVAVEALLWGGKLELLALFDKPDPLDGPFFEETIYVTPSSLPGPVQSAIALQTEREARRLGLREGPVHAELRLSPRGPVIIEIASRSIGGLCSQMLRFGAGMSLEEVILRQALHLSLPTLDRERGAEGVMMIPIPREGTLVAVRGREQALAVPGISDVIISIRVGERVVPLPEGSRYLGFIFARAETPDRAVALLREAHGRLAFDIVP
ncbi:MAG: ATP-grasp domain-containing protein [Deltaproteobacteria bacterium]|nr:ATP-grasp domain-containing protein [Deltaproteobacteria bacterium]